MNKKLYMVSLGCSKNLVDSEVMLGLLEKDGYRVTDEPGDANLLLVNTCGFIGSAVKEAIDEILALARYKKDDPAKKLVVTGCLVQRYGADLEKELPEVDIFIGTNGFHTIVEKIYGRKSSLPLAHSLAQAPYLMDSGVPRKISTPPHRAYMKITEGCINRCSYCLIPDIRGKLRSRTVEDLINEARRLGEKGIKELTLVAQDLLAYGIDLDGKVNLMDLLKQLLAETDIPWIRLLYLHPARVKEDLLRLMAENSRLLPYLDIPFQHVSNRILRLMSRPYTKKQLRQLIETIRAILPQALRTTMMVGFPGETAEDIAEMAAFLQDYHFDHLGVFAYANEEGCRAAGLSGQVPEDTKEERLQQIMALQADISFNALQKQVGKVEQVLVEGFSKETDLLLEGRTRYQAPDEIDGCVYITRGTVKPGALVDVVITEAHTYDLVGEISE